MRAMNQRVLLVAWKGSAALAWAEALRADGFTVLVEDTTGERAWRTAKERGIDLVVIDGERKPSHGRATGFALRDTAKTRHIPIVWTNLNEEQRPLVLAEVHPDWVVEAPCDAPKAIAAIRRVLEETRPPAAAQRR